MSHAHMHHGAEKVVKASAPQASSDMNVTPLIDVLLVLLVIFLIVMPTMVKFEAVMTPTPPEQGGADFLPDAGAD